MYFLCVASLIQHFICDIRPCGTGGLFACLHNITLYQCTKTYLSVLLIDKQVVSSFGILQVITDMSICIQVFLRGGVEGCTYVCISIVYTFRSRIVGSLGMNIFSFIRYY